MLKGCKNRMLLDCQKKRGGKPKAISSRNSKTNKNDDSRLDLEL
jgi:hypothetical protein